MIVLTTFLRWSPGKIEDRDVPSTQSRLTVPGDTQTTEGEKLDLLPVWFEREGLDLPRLFFDKVC